MNKPILVIPITLKRLVANWPTDYPDALTEARLALILAQLDNKTSTLATQATLASVLARLDVDLSTRALEAGGNLATIAVKDFATQTTLALMQTRLDLIATEATLAALSAKVTACNTGAVVVSTLPALVESNIKLGVHENTVYKNAYVKLTADGNIIVGVANKLLYVHWVKVVMGADTEGDVYNKSGGSIIDHLPHNDREGFVSGFVPYPAAVWKSQVGEELYWDMTSATGEAYFTLVYSEQSA